MSVIVQSIFSNRLSRRTVFVTVLSPLTHIHCYHMLLLFIAFIHSAAVIVVYLFHLITAFFWLVTWGTVNNCNPLLAPLHVLLANSVVVLLKLFSVRFLAKSDFSNISRHLYWAVDAGTFWKRHSHCSWQKNNNFSPSDHHTPWSMKYKSTDIGYYQKYKGDTQHIYLC